MILLNDLISLKNNKKNTKNSQLFNSVSDTNQRNFTLNKRILAKEVTMNLKSIINKETNEIKYLIL